jgi:hypothetical protein
MSDDLTPTDLWKAYDALMRPRRTRLQRSDVEWQRTDLSEADAWGVCNVERHRERLARSTIETVTLPSLFDQLIAAVQSGQGGRAHGIQESKPPLDSSSLSLLIRISGTVRDALRERGLRRTHDTASELRALITAVNTEADPQRITDCTTQVRSWIGQIKATISSESTRSWRMHGAACRVCSSTTVPSVDDDGTITRLPALLVHSHDGIINRVECSYCGSVLTGDELTIIINDTLKAKAKSDPDGKMTA